MGDYGVVYGRLVYGIWEIKEYDMRDWGVVYGRLVYGIWEIKE